MGTPYCLRTLPPWSLSSVKGRLWPPAKAACRPTESELTPITSAPAAEKTSWLSRKAHASAVHPDVLSRG